MSELLLVRTRTRYQYYYYPSSYARGTRTVTLTYGIQDSLGTRTVTYSVKLRDPGPENGASTNGMGTRTTRRCTVATTAGTSDYHFSRLLIGEECVAAQDNHAPLEYE